MKILLLDDHPLFRKGIADVLLDADVASDVREASSAEDAFECLRQEDDIDVIFLDLTLPDMDGLVFLGQLTEQKFLLPVLVLSGNTDPASIDFALSAGASAYLDKSAAPEEILTALETVQRGGCYVGSHLRQPLDHYRAGMTISGRPLIRLTGRQQEVLRCLAEGLSNQQIAMRLNIAESTVKGHVSVLFSLFGVDNRTRCVQAAQRCYLLQ